MKCPNCGTEHAGVGESDGDNDYGDYDSGYGSGYGDYG